MLTDLLKNPAVWYTSGGILCGVLILLFVIFFIKRNKKEKVVEELFQEEPKKDIIETISVKKEEETISSYNKENEELDAYMKEQQLLSKRCMEKVKEVQQEIDTFIEDIKDKVEKEVVLEDLMACYNKGLSDKTMLLNLISTQFSPKDSRSKEVLETTKAEIVIIDDNLEVEKFSYFVKPEKYSKLSSYCKKITDVTQIDVNTGISFKDLINNLIKVMEECDSIYSWGKSVYLQLQKEGYEKLDNDTYNRLMNILNKKYVNYKEDFAERNEITPCSLIKAADLSDQVKEKDAVDTMTNIYKVERI